MENSSNKESLLHQFNRMKAFEEWANGFYLQVADDPRIEEGKIKSAFQKVANDEEDHGKLVQRIINIIENGL